MDTKNLKSLFKNMGYLYVMQAASQLAPLIAVPYLIRVLGLEKFGLLSFSYAYVRFFVIITNFGFHLSGTQLISKHRTDRKMLSEIFCSIMVVKVLLLLCCLSLFVFSLYTIPIFNDHREIYLISFIAVVGNVVYPDWFLMGIEAIKAISVIHIIVRFCSLIGLLILVKAEGDLCTAALLQFSVEFVAGLVALTFIRLSFNLKWIFPRPGAIKELITKSWRIFTAQVYVSLFSSSNTFILGLFASNEVVGAFATGEKIVRTITGFINPVSSAIYPKVCHMFHHSVDLTLSFLRKVLLTGCALFFMLSCVLYWCTDEIVSLISGQIVPEIGFVIRMMAFVPLTIFVDNIYGTQILLNLSMKKEFANAILYAGLFSVITSFIFVPIFGLLATATICLFSQFLVMILMIIPVRRNGINLLPQVNSADFQRCAI